MAYYKYDGTLAAETGPDQAFFGNHDGAETTVGTSGADSIWGGAGDVLKGGAGNDIYWLQADKSLITIVENANEGVDTVAGWQSLSLASYANIENVRVENDGTYGAGNHLDNIVQGGAGSQQLYGGGGQDVLIGGAGADIFIVYKGEGNDVIQDFNAAEDKVRLKAGFTTFDQVKSHMTQVGADVKLDLGGGDGLMFRNITVGQFTAANFQLQLDKGGLTATFTENFNSLSLYDPESNPTGIWRTEYGYQGTQGVGSYTLVSNDEKQIYTSPYFRDHPGDFGESPFTVNGDGTVSIWAKASSNPELFGYQYTSGMLSTQASFSQTYGYFEIRADLPDAAGAWPAFWLIPADGSWPPELDVMETLTVDPNAAWTSKHSALGGGGHTSQGVMNYVPDTADGFHTYGAMWTPTDLVYYIDGVEVFRTTTPADMNKPMFMIANLALGGWGGAIDVANLPAEYKIDYIQAYALPASGSGGGAPPPPADPPATPPPVVSPPPVTSGGGSSGGGSSGGGSSSGGTADAPAIDPPKVLVAGDGGETLIGGSGADRITGGKGQDYLRGGEGNDQMWGGAGFDDMHGNQGDDRLYGGDGDDWVVGGKDNDLLNGDAGDDIVYGNLGNDWCDGGDGNDIVRGGQGDDRVLGQAGNDWLSGDRGDDTITGGAGADIFHTFSEAGLDRVTDFNFAEGDRVQVDPGTHYAVAQVGADVVIDMGAGNQMILVGVQMSSLGEGWIFGG